MMKVRPISRKTLLPPPPSTFHKPQSRAGVSPAPRAQQRERSGSRSQCAASSSAEALHEPERGLSQSAAREWAKDAWNLKGSVPVGSAAPSSILHPLRHACLSAALLLTGCRSTHSPTVDVLGSYFPAWIICIVIGLLVTVFVRQILIYFKLDPHLRPAPLVYLCLTACFTLATWLIFFKN